MRSPEKISVPISKINVDPAFNFDQRFVRYIRDAELGKIDVALTRLSIEDIHSGFFVFENGAARHVSNLKTDHLDLVVKMIRGGRRPTIDIYWCPFAPNGGAYVCPDDEITLLAYKKLEIVLAPCRVFRPKRVAANEGAIWLRRAKELTKLTGLVAPNLTTYASFIGDDLSPTTEILNLLLSRCADLRAAIVSFHSDSDEQTHYHHMVHATVQRHERAIDSILRLLELRRIEHAETVARLAYEAFLNFYIDWLSPEFFGPRLQLLSAVRTAQSQKNRVLDDSLKVLSNFVEFFEKASDKGLISPLGSYFHSAIYPPLSLVAHQSYVNLEQEALSFVERHDPTFDGRAKQLARYLDVCTATLLTRIGNDVGFSTK